MKKVFEISWEVCNKVGGTYTVLSSKAPYVKEQIKEYYAIGPYFRGKNNVDFEKRETPRDLEEIFEILKERKIYCHYGIWKKTNVKTILIDFLDYNENKNYIKTRLWEDYNIDSLNSDFWFEEPVVWSYAVGIFLEEVYKKQDSEIVAHFHEWLTGAGLLYLKNKNIKIGTVFTTHATVLGRAMASDKKIFSEEHDAYKEAIKFGVLDKFQMEKQTALNSDIFTTVSEITSEECERILERKPRVIINGLDFQNMPDMEEIPSMHKINKEKIKDLVIANFFPYYYFNVEKSLFYYISGRYEPYAKGVDIYIKSLGNLNERLKQENSEKEIIAFLLIPSDMIKVHEFILKNLFLIKNLKENIGFFSDELKKKIFLSLFSKDFFQLERDKSILEYEKMLSDFYKKGNPSITTHELKDKNDFILKLIRESGLENKKEDRVKIIFYPAYINESDGLFNSDYYNIVSGFNLGIFPSFYEPWGYTPFESAALGVPTVTTDLSGFGKYIIENKKDKEGITVLKRETKNDEEIIKELEEKMYSYYHLDKIHRIKEKTIAQVSANNISWKNLIKEYLKAYEDSILKLKD